MASDNLFDVVEELKQITADLRRTVYGDPATRSSGLMSEFDGLRMDVKALEADLKMVKSKRPNVLAWTSGYLMFCVAVVFAIAALLNQLQGHHLMGLPAEWAAWLAMGFALAALLLFVAGFGWFDQR